MPAGAHRGSSSTSTRHTGVSFAPGAPSPSQTPSERGPRNPLSSEAADEARRLACPGALGHTGTIRAPWSCVPTATGTAGVGAQRVWAPHEGRGQRPAAHRDRLGFRVPRGCPEGGAVGPGVRSLLQAPMSAHIPWGFAATPFEGASNCSFREASSSLWRKESAQAPCSRGGKRVRRQGRRVP